jgi:hypothetical protein
MALGLIATVAACESRNLDDGGAAGAAAGGASGSGGVGGTNGLAGGTSGSTAGTGGSGGGLAACGGGGGAADVVALAIAGPDGLAVASDVTAAVTVSTIDACTTATCPSMRRIVLTAADARSWTVNLRYTAMPADLVKVGDAFDMTIQAHYESFIVDILNQTIVLAHGTDLVLFASSLGTSGRLVEPDLQAFGITVADGGACSGAGPLEHAALVTVGTDSSRVGPGTTRIGWLTFTDAAFHASDSGSDLASATLMAGFRTP